MRILSTLILPAKLEHLGTFIASATQAAEVAGVNPKKIFDIELAMEEALVNIIHYAYEKGTGDIEVICKSDAAQFFVMEIIDTGPPFDMLSVPPPDVTLNISERKIGGLGIYFIKKVMDGVGYRREEAKNILEMKVRLAS